MKFIAGVGMTSFSNQVLNAQELCVHAVEEALDDSDLSLEDIDAVITANNASENSGEQKRFFPALMSSVLGKKDIPFLGVSSACCSGGVALWSAIHSDYDTVLVIGVDKYASVRTPYLTQDFVMAADRLYEQNEGLIFPAQNALIAQQYMKKYGATLDDLGRVALKNHAHAYLNPKAKFYGKKVTMEMIEKSPVIASPLRLFDCSISVDGAAAAIVSKKKGDVKVMASSMCTSRLSFFESEDVTSWESTKIAGRNAFREASLLPKNIDFAEVHDAFTSVELMAYEDIGFAKKGEGKALVREGKTSINGCLPVNPSGGLKAKGHPISATGIAQVYEIVKQMKNEAGKRQLDKVNTALAHNVGGAGSSSTVHIFKKV